MCEAPVRYQVDEVHRVVETTIRAGFSYADIVAVFAALRSDARIRPDFDRIAVYEASAAVLTAAQIRDMVDAARQLAHVPGTRVAVVVPDDVTFGIMRMYEMHGDAQGLFVRVFRTRAEASEWLSGPRQR